MATILHFVVGKKFSKKHDNNFIGASFRNIIPEYHIHPYIYALKKLIIIIINSAPNIAIDRYMSIVFNNWFITHCTRTSPNAELMHPCMGWVL